MYPIIQCVLDDLFSTYSKVALKQRRSTNRSTGINAMTSVRPAESASGTVEFQECARGKHFVMTFIQLCMTCVANGFCASLAKISERILNVDELITVNGQAQALHLILPESTTHSLPFSFY